MQRYFCFCLGLAAVLGCSAAPAAVPETGSAPGAGLAPRFAPTAPPAAADAPARERLQLGFSAVTGGHAALWTAVEGGILARAGIDAELTGLGSSQAAQAALASGEIVTASVGGSTTVLVQLAGGDVTITGAVFDRMPYQLAAVREVTGLPDLRGKIIGVNRFGGPADLAVRYLLRREGVDPDRETQLIQVGGQGERVAALRTGQLAATVVDPPFRQIAEQEGLQILIDAAELGIPYPQDVLAMNRPWLATHRPVARQVLQALREGARLFASDAELGRGTLRRWTQVDDPVLLDEAYRYFRGLMPETVLPSPNGLQLMLDEIAETEPRARVLRPADLVDATLAAELR